MGNLIKYFIEQIRFSQLPERAESLSLIVSNGKNYFFFFDNRRAFNRIPMNAPATSDYSGNRFLICRHRDLPR